LELIKQEDTSPLGYIFAQAPVLTKIKTEYCRFIDELFPSAVDFLPFVKEVTGSAALLPQQIQVNRATLEKMKATEFINIAFPPPEVDEHGRVIPNRQQQVINTAVAFMELDITKHVFTTPEAKERFIQLRYAMFVISLFNNIDVTITRIKQKLDDPNVPEDDRKVLASAMVDPYSLYCSELQKNFEHQAAEVQHILKRGVRATNLYGRLHNWLEDAARKMAEIIEKLGNLFKAKHSVKVEEKSKGSLQLDVHVSKQTEIRHKKEVSKILAEEAKRKFMSIAARMAKKSASTSSTAVADSQTEKPKSKPKK